MTSRRSVRWHITGLALLAIVPVAAGALSVHLRLLRSEPAANARLAAAPTQVKLWFSQRAELAVTSIKLRSGSGATAVERVLAPLSRASANDAPITANVGAALAPGHFEVVWRTMARDGHVLNGVIPFDMGGTPAQR